MRTATSPTPARLRAASALDASRAFNSSALVKLGPACAMGASFASKAPVSSPPATSEAGLGRPNSMRLSSMPAVRFFGSLRRVKALCVSPGRPPLRTLSFSLSKMRTPFAVVSSAIPSSVILKRLFEQHPFMRSNTPNVTQGQNTPRTTGNMSLNTGGESEWSHR